MKRFHVISLAITYLFGLGYFLVLNETMGGLTFKGDLWNCFLLFWMTQAMYDVMVWADQVFFYFLPKTIISKKKEIQTPGKGFWFIAYYQASTRFLLYGNFAMLAYYGFIELHQSPSLSSILMFQLQSILAIWIRDVTGMLTFHSWTHSSKEAYKHHKLHHSFAVNVNMWNSMVIDWFDVFGVDGIGGAVAIGLHWAVFGKPLPLHTLLFMAWHDGSAHSLNPYFGSFLNPFWDWFIATAVSHNLHHVKLTTHFTVFPFHHLLPGGRKQDIDAYNKVFYTEIC